MSINEMVERLQEGAKQNPVANSVLLVLSSRKRHRSILNLNPLVRQMKKEGFQYSKQEYGKVLVWLEQMNLGRIVRTKRGKVKGLIDIKYKLDSIGNSALQGKILFDSKPKTTYLPPLTMREVQAIRAKHTRPVIKTVQLTIDDCPISVTMPNQMSMKTLISSLSDLIK